MNQRLPSIFRYKGYNTPGNLYGGATWDSYNNRVQFKLYDYRKPDSNIKYVSYKRISGRNYVLFSFLDQEDWKKMKSNWNLH